jgi:cytochrome c
LSRYVAAAGIILSSSQAFAADADNGERLAQRWCAACHVVTAAQTSTPTDQEASSVVTSVMTGPSWLAEGVKQRRTFRNLAASELALALTAHAATARTTRAVDSVGHFVISAPLTKNPSRRLLSADGHAPPHAIAVHYSRPAIAANDGGPLSGPAGLSAARPRASQQPNQSSIDGTDTVAGSVAS